MEVTIDEILKILDNSLDPQYSPEAAERKVRMAEVLTLVAIVQELDRANRLKERELKMKG